MRHADSGGTIQWYKNGSTMGAPVTGVGTSGLYPSVGSGGGPEAITTNFGQNSWNYLPPGFSGVH